jgi:ribosomal protein L7Ae-like RNA K-turn-binding protein
LVLRSCDVAVSILEVMEDQMRQRDVVSGEYQILGKVERGKAFNVLYNLADFDLDTPE